MLLAIDIGNTNIVFAGFQNDVLVHTWRIQTVAARSSDEYAAVLNELFTLKNLTWSSFSDIIISSVVPEIDRHIIRLCEDYIGHTPVMVGADNVDIEVLLDNPAEIGPDRLVNAVAVRAGYQCPAIVIDFGTATTFDVIDAQGRYAGGVIAPGINLSMSALHQAAARLPSVTVEKPVRVIGRNTVDAMQSGVFWGYVSLIEGVVAKIIAEMEAGAKQHPTVIATGGLAPLFAAHLPVINTVDQSLTLNGLFTIYKTVKSKS